VRPGEISLAHKGVLFLDELPEFNRNVLEVLRQPLEDNYVTISRASGALTYPADFMFVAAMNPCPCGNLFSGNSCSCSQNEISRYMGRISGPLLDRIDIQVETSRINYNDLRYSGSSSESSADIRKRVERALDIQKKRYEGTGIKVNAQLSPAQIEKYCPIDEGSHKLLKNAFDNLNLSVRAYHKILKVSRTLADMDQSDSIETIHISEAIGYRSLDRKYWN
jgi:magnesium chelatase family protein